MMSGLFCLLWFCTAAAPQPPQMAPDVLCTVNGEALKLSDLESVLYLDQYQVIARDVLPVLVRELAIRQAVSSKGISVKKDDIDGYMADLDRQFRDSQGMTVTEYLRNECIEEEFFRRKLETTLGLFFLAGGKGRPSTAMADPAVRLRMEQTMEKLLPAIKVEADPRNLPEDVAATVNDERITVADAGRVARMTLAEEARKQGLAFLKRYVLVRQELDRRGLRLSDDDLDYQLKLASQAKATRIGEQEFGLEEVLEKLGRDVRLLRRQYGFRTVAMLTRMVRDGIEDRELEDRYRANPAAFGDGVPRVGHILIRTSDDQGQPLPAAQLRKAKEEADEVHRRLVDGEDFAKLALAFSQDRATADRGGDLGWLDVKRDVPEMVAKTAGGLGPGEFAPPVLSGQGWHVVRVAEKRRVTFEEAKPLVLSAVIAGRRNDLLGKLEKAAEVKTGPARP